MRVRFLFSLAIAVGITPQLLPAVVSTSLATGTRQLARRKVLVKRLVCIEDLGDMDILVDLLVLKGESDFLVVRPLLVRTTSLGLGVGGLWRYEWPSW